MVTRKGKRVPKIIKQTTFAVETLEKIDEIAKYYKVPDEKHLARVITMCVDAFYDEVARKVEERAANENELFAVAGDDFSTFKEEEHVSARTTLEIERKLNELAKEKEDDEPYVPIRTVILPPVE